MIVEVFESANNEATTEIKIDSVDVFQVLPFCDKVATLLTKEELEALLAAVRPTEEVNMKEAESYYAQDISVWQDGNIPPGNITPIDIPHHIGLRVVLESVLQKYGTSDNLQIRIN